MLHVRFALPVLLLALITPLRAAVSIDIDLDRLRAMPGAATIAATLAAALPDSARARLAALDSRFGFVPGRDLRRVVITVPERGAPSVRLVGLPAERIVAALAADGGGTTTYASGLVGHALPRRPQASFVALAADQALIACGDRLASDAAAPAALLAPVAGQAVVVRVVPGAHPRLPAMRLVQHGEMRLDGAGVIRATVVAHDDVGAVELERRFGVLTRMLAVGAEGGLEPAIDLAPVLAGARLTRSGTTLELALTVPEALRAKAVERLLARLTSRLGAG